MRVPRRVVITAIFIGLVLSGYVIADCANTYRLDHEPALSSQHETGLHDLNASQQRAILGIVYGAEDPIIEENLFPEPVTVYHNGATNQIQTVPESTCSSGGSGLLLAGIGIAGLVAGVLYLRRKFPNDDT